MSVDPGILDANVHAYAVDLDAPQHAASRALLEAASDPSVTLYVTSQILCELYSVITNPRRVLVVSSPTEALSILSAMLALPGLQVLPTPARAVAGWMQLLQRHPVTGGDIFDLQIVATMQANGVNRIYTFNSDDFKVFPELVTSRLICFMLERDSKDSYEMGQTIELSDESGALIKRQAAAHGLSVDAWVQALAAEKAHTEDIQPGRQKSQAAAARILEVQKCVKPDPQGWNFRDYIDHGHP